MSLNIFDRAISGEIVDLQTVHGIDRETLEDTAQFSVHRWAFQGEYDKLVEWRNGHYCNQLITNEQDSIVAPRTFLQFSDTVIIGMNVERGVGGRGVLNVTTKNFRRGYEGGLDFETVSKDIHYWRQLCYSNKPNLNDVMLWEQMKDNPETLDKYYAFKYIDKSGEEKEIEKETATRALCEMIARGVESYNEYIPTLVLTWTLAAHPSLLLTGNSFQAGALLGTVITNMGDLFISNTQGFDFPLGQTTDTNSPATDFWGDGSGYVLCTGDQIRCNSDGSFTVTRAFSRFRQVEKELYLGAGGDYSPYDN